MDSEMFKDSATDVGTKVTIIATKDVLLKDTSEMEMS
jgi:hypothetical protein